MNSPTSGVGTLRGDGRIPLGRLLPPAVVLLAVAVRLCGIAIESLWLDEATSLMLAQMDLGDLIRWTAGDIHPPLYYALLHYWIALGQSEEVLRGLSVLAGVLTVGVSYALGHTLFDRQTGLWAALLLAVNPFHVWYSQETRMYAWLTLLFSLSMLLALRFWERPRWRTWFAYVLVTAAGFYTHYYMIFSLAVQTLGFVYLLVRRRVDRRMLFQWVASQIAVLILFRPWLPNLLVNLSGGGGWLAFTEGKPSLIVLVQTAISYMIGPSRADYPSLVRRAGYLLFLVTLVLRRRRRGPRRGTSTGPAQEHRFDSNESLLFTLAYLALPLGIAWVSSQLFKPIYSARYMLPFLVPFTLWLARGLGNLSWVPARGWLAAALVGVMSLGVYVQSQTLEKPAWRAWAARVVDESQAGDVVLFMPGWHAGPFDYYADGVLPLERELPMLLDHSASELRDAVDQAISEHPRVWLFWEKGHYTDPEGEVLHHLTSVCRKISEREMPQFGRVALFETVRGESGD